MKSAWFALCLVAVVAVLLLAQARPDEPGNAATPATDPMRGKEAGQVRDDNSLKMKLVWCPPGDFEMTNVEFVVAPAAKLETVADDDEGDPDDEPASKPRETAKFTPVKVVLAGHWLGKYEVTQSEWKQVMQTEPWKGENYTKEGPDFPATFVDWIDATNFCRKLTDLEREAGRLPNDWEYTLPTEAQWERACRVLIEPRPDDSNDVSRFDDFGWFMENIWKTREYYPHAVGQKKANPWGLFDMHGNVWEWCYDIYTDKLPGGRDPLVKPDEKTPENSRRVIRGGGWNFSAGCCRPEYRYKGLPSARSDGIGFRVALSAVR